MKHSLIAAWVFSALVVGVQASSVILDDTFPQPDATTWYDSGSMVSHPNPPQTAMVIPNGSGNTAEFALAYFTPQGNPLTLGIGDSLTLSFTFSYSGTVTSGTQAVRVGLFNSSAGTRIASNNLGIGNATTTYKNYSGYAAVFDPAGGNPLAITVRNSTHDPFMTNGTLVPDTSQAHGGAVSALTAGTSYTGTLTITRDSSDMKLSLSLSDGQTATSTILSPNNFSSFDTIGLFNGSGGTLSFSEVKLTYDAVPEPRSAALVGGAVSLLFGLALLRARRAAQS